MLDCLFGMRGLWAGWELGWGVRLFRAISGVWVVWLELVEGGFVWEWAWTCLC